MIRRLVVALSAAITGVLLTSSAGLAAAFTLFGDATFVAGHDSPTGVQLRSSATIAPGFGAIGFSLPAGTTFADISALATDFMVTEGDCGGGAPRFSIEFANGKNAFVYIGPAPNFTHCPSGWSSTGNLLSAPHTIDTSQLGGTFYDSLTHAYAAYGSLTVKSIALVVDAFFAVAGGTQTVVVDNVNINGTIFTFESKDSCKDGGWQTFTSSPGPFKNQGDCVSFFATGGRNS